MENIKYAAVSFSGGKCNKKGKDGTDPHNFGFFPTFKMRSSLGWQKNKQAMKFTIFFLHLSQPWSGEEMKT